MTYQLERSVAIQATPETVFRYFTDSARWASWWGAGSTIDARPGGRLYIRYPNGTEASGEVLEVEAPRRIVFTFGYASGKPMAAGSSRVTIRLEAEGAGTRLHLVHELETEEARDAHVQGWRFQLSVFANVVANEMFSAAANKVDAWFDAWSIGEEPARRAALTAIVTSGIRFRDQYAALDGLEDLVAHTGAVQRFMPGVRMARSGEVRHCQGVVLADWSAKELSGTNVFVFSADGKINSVTGITNTMPPV